MESVSYLIAEHREVNGQPEIGSTWNSQGQGKGLFSWLAAPAPIGSLNFVTPNAAFVVAGLSKDPKAIADDLLAMTVPNNDSQKNELTEAEEKLQINFREDLAANLGGDFLLTLDGPVLPTPSWKAVIEVNDSDRLEQALERLTEAIRNQSKGNAAHSITIEPSDEGGQRYYSVQDTVTGKTLAQYTYANGYMIVAPSRALVSRRCRRIRAGIHWQIRQRLKHCCPGWNENYSAVAYQNLSPVLTPLLSQLDGETANAVRKLAADARPLPFVREGNKAALKPRATAVFLALTS